MNSYLSEYVKTLLEISNCDNDHSNGDKYVDSSNIIFKTHEVESLLNNSAENVAIHEQSEEWFRQKIKTITPALQECAMVLDHSEDAEIIIREAECQLLQWTHRVQEIIAYWKIYSDSLQRNKCKNILVVLGLSAIIERSLGNVFLLKGNTVPFLLRDLLDTEEIQGILGKKLVFLMQLLFGTPKGLNIRNVTWHGFPNCEEVKNHHASAFFVLLLHIGHVLKTRGDGRCSPEKGIPERPLNVSLAQSWEEIVAEHAFVDLRVRGNAAKNLLTHNLFAGRQRAVVWSQIFEYFEEENGSLALTLLLPQFEQMMRIVFCEVNNCPARLLTAEATELYTTLEEIFDRNVLNSSNGQSSPNKIHERLSENSIELYEDLFVHLNGLRIRDRLSHGEVNVLAIPQFILNNIVNCILCLSIYVVVKIDANQARNQTLQEAITQNIDSYRSRHHPAALLKHKIISIRKSLVRWKEFKIPEELRFPSNQAGASHDDGDDDSQSVDKFETIDRLAKEEIADADIKKLTFVQSIETISLLQSIASNVHQICENVIANLEDKYTAYTHRRMRSRQRVTYSRIIRTLHLHNSAVTSLVATVINVATKENCTQLHNKFLKKVLKYAENMSSNTQLDKNRWNESFSLTFACIILYAFRPKD